MLRKILIAMGLIIPMAASPLAAGAQTTPPEKFPADGAYQVKTSTGLQYTDVTVGSGASPRLGQQVKVSYAGYLLDGTMFDASAKHGDGTFTFPIGEGQVIKGWDEGVMGMKVGGERLLRIPPELGYGGQAMGRQIPAYSTLLFDVKLIGIQ